MHRVETGDFQLIDRMDQEPTDSQSSSEMVVVIDSLPYVDSVNEDYEQYALALIEEEMKKIPARKIQPVPDVKFRTEIMKSQYNRYLHQVVPQSSPSTFDKSVAPPETEDDVGAWEEALNRGRIAYELERIRAVRLEVEKDGAGSSGELWRQYNELLDQDQKLLSDSFTSQRRTVEGINLARQQQQSRCGQELDVLYSQSEDLVNKVYQLKRAVAEMEEELKDPTSC